MVLQESGENYLETILLLHRQNGAVRSIDIADTLGYSKPSVSRAVKLLKNNGLITVEAGGNIVLTSKGLKRAEAIYERHATLTVFLKDVLHVSESIAEEDACRIEHIISDETYQKLKAFLTKNCSLS